MPIIRLILGDQLNENHSWFQVKNKDVLYLMMEILPETTYVKHHIQKLVGYLAAMRAFAANMENKGHKLLYIKLEDKQNLQSFEKNIVRIIKEQKADKFEYLLPDEYRLDRLLSEFTARLSVPSGSFDTEHFYTSRQELRDFFNGKKTYLMESYYRHLRKKHKILMVGDKPEGGIWNFDKENRSRLDEGTGVEEPLTFSHDQSEIYEMITKLKVPHFGEIDPGRFGWPLNLEESLQMLKHFTGKLLPYFGTYQDAMDTRDRSLFHSRLSFSLNTKMISPKEVVKGVVDHWRERGNAKINQVEGFVRQVLGWREYLRGVYWANMPGFSRMNYFGNSKKLPIFYWTGKTRMNCMKHAIGQSLQEAYAHHIQRLMVTGNFALLAGIDPDEVDRWYLGVYIDAIEWVEITNTRGMSQFADGGLIATKPYVSSANYIRKMSNYCENCHYDYKMRTGERACPFNSLYWNFMVSNREKLEKNPRIGMVYRSWDGMDEKTRRDILAWAEVLLRKLDVL